MSVGQLPWNLFCESHLKPLLVAKNIDRARLILQDYLKEQPSHIEALITLGNVYALSSWPNRFVHALHYYRLAQEQTQDNPDPYRAEAKLQWTFGHKQEALKKIKRAFYIRPDDAQALELYESYKSADTLPDLKQIDLLLYTGHPDITAMPYPYEMDQKAVGGSESVYLLMARGLARLGVRLALFSNFKEPMISQGVPCYDLKDFFVLSSRGGLPITIVSRFLQPFKQGFKSPKKILWLHDRATEACQSEFKQADPQIDEYWMLTNYQRQTYENFCQTPQYKIWMTTNPLDEELFGAPLALSQRVRGQIVFASRLYRGMDILLEVYQRIKKELPYISLKVCTYSGYRSLKDDPDVAPYLPELDKLGVTVDLLGKRELVEVIRKSHLMVYPNTALGGENCCLASLEAQGAGTPIITADNGGMRETVIDGETGLVLPFNGQKHQLVDSLVAQTLRLLKDDALWERFSKQAYSHAWTHHATQTVAQNWIRHLGL